MRLRKQPDEPEYCAACEQQLHDGKCDNVNCEIGQANVTAGATRDTAKATASAAAGIREPAPRRQFSRRGSVD